MTAAYRVAADKALALGLAAVTLMEEKPDWPAPPDPEAKPPDDPEERESDSGLRLAASRF